MQIARSIRYGFIALAATFVNVAPPSGVAAAPVMQTQAPCVSVGDGVCFRITAQNASATRTMRSIVLQPPSAGKAWVQFHGTGLCTNGTPNTGSPRGKVEFETQIVSTSTETPSRERPGGNTFSFTLEEVSGNTPDGTHAFNLSSTRVFPVTSTAAQTYYFRLKFTRIDSRIRCDFHNLSFSVLFMPK